jgi:hypothetical protein
MIALDSYLIFSKASWVSRLPDSTFSNWKLHELTIKVKMGIIKAYMISTLHNIGIFRFDHDRNKLFIFLSFQIKIDEQTHRIQISQLADDTTPKMRYLLL